MSIKSIKEFLAWCGEGDASLGKRREMFHARLEEVEKQKMDLQQAPAEMTAGSSWIPDERIPKALRDLMIANSVNEWDIQNVCEAKGYVPVGTPLYQYEEVNPGFTAGVLVGAWTQVYGAIQEMKAKEAIPFN